MSGVKRYVSEAIVWVDIETTGTDSEKDEILEIACIITDRNLKELDRFTAVINHPDSILDNMADWCKYTHANSGLIEQVKKSVDTVKSVEKKLFAFISRLIPPKEGPLAGFSVHFDRKFIERHMPSITKYLTYRIIDVSTLSELFRRWYPEKCQRPDKPETVKHRALDDVLESIKTLKYYQDTFFYALSKPETL